MDEAKTSVLQPRQQPRKPILRFVAPHRYRQRLPLPDEHHQLFAPCDAVVHEITLQEQVLLRGQWRDHRWEFRSL